MIEHNYVSENNYPKQKPLMSSNKKLECRKVPYAIKYHVPNKYTQREQYGYHMLFMYFPFRYKNQLKYSSSYNEKLNFPDVLETVNLN